MRTYAKLSRLTEPRGEDLEATFQRLAELLRTTGKTATVQWTILGAEEPRRWAINLTARQARLQKAAVKVPDLEIVTREATWWEIAEGRLSPLEAFLQGRMRVLGDTDLGTYLLRTVAQGEGEVAICGG